MASKDGHIDVGIAHQTLAASLILSKDADQDLWPCKEIVIRATASAQAAQALTAERTGALVGDFDGHIEDNLVIEVPSFIGRHLGDSILRTRHQLPVRPSDQLIATEYVILVGTQRKCCRHYLSRYEQCEKAGRRFHTQFIWRLGICWTLAFLLFLFGRHFVGVSVVLVALVTRFLVLVHCLRLFRGCVELKLVCIQLKVLQPTDTAVIVQC